MVRSGSKAVEDAQVQAAQAGDRRAIAALWTENRRWVAAVILAHKPRQCDLEDLLQDVAMTMVTKLDTLRETTFFRAWLRQVAVNTARAAGRSGQTRQRVEANLREMMPLQTDDPVSTGMTEETRRLLALVDGLPESYREPLLLRAVHGLRSRQIGEILDLPEAVVDTRVARARRMLRDRADALESGDSSADWMGEQE